MIGYPLIWMGFFLVLAPVALLKGRLDPANGRARPPFDSSSTLRRPFDGKSGQNPNEVAWRSGMKSKCSAKI
jgi:hypothetical protein